MELMSKLKEADNRKLLWLAKNTKAWKDADMFGVEAEIYAEIENRLYPEYDGETVTFEEWGWRTPEGDVRYSMRTKNTEPPGVPAVALHPMVGTHGYDALWLWFGIGRDSWLTIPRVLLHEMQDEWQGKLAELLAEYEQAFPNQLDIKAHVMIRKNGHFTSEYAWLNNYRYPDREKINAMRPNDPDQRPPI